MSKAFPSVIQSIVKRSKVIRELKLFRELTGVVLRSKLEVFESQM